MYAMEFDRTDRIIFSPIPIPEDVVEGLRDGFSAHPLHDVNLDVPPDYNARPAGTEAPTLTLCVSKVDPKEYKVFKYAREIDRQQYDLAGRTWAVFNTEDQWRKFLQLRREMDQMAREAIGIEAPEDAFDSDDAEALAHAGQEG